MSDHGNKKKPFDLIRRGEKKPTPSGTLTFIGLRLADIPLQYALLYPTSAFRPAGVRLLTSLGLRTPHTHPFSITTLLLSSASFSWTTSPSSLILLAMSVGSAAKQIYWQTAISQESFPASAAVAVSLYNTVVNSANTLLFLALGTTSLLSRPLITFPFVSPFSAWSTIPLSTILGTLLYVSGITIETLSERQRAVFKARPENKGRVCKVGLWGWARHINYFGYALWRGGYCMVASGWVGGIVMGIWQAWDLGSRAVAVQDDYCGKRYGEQWVTFKREVPYRIVPRVW
ncbi:hypothetical protein FHL15_010285 [Xylaria flabelliformis]|uniref:Steroid 5-alpha reductase C-terminal domain-containing protein n=1 Tax=Xylaria flabelliformis TaxID=2512241 RepID=A0A553HLN6_9PEZI|nr:hypothetical protein FHL15_010285 [Xylaria flabelliformis]